MHTAQTTTHLNRFYSRQLLYVAAAQNGVYIITSNEASSRLGYFKQLIYDTLFTQLHHK